MGSSITENGEEAPDGVLECRSGPMEPNIKVNGLMVRLTVKVRLP